MFITLFLQFFIGLKFFKSKLFESVDLKNETVILPAKWVYLGTVETRRGTRKPWENPAQKKHVIEKKEAVLNEKGSF